MLGSGLGEVIDAVRIKHGLTNVSWHVTTRAGEWVVRLSNPSEQALQIDRYSEAVVLAAVARAGIGPEVFCCDPERHLLITRYAGPTWNASQAEDPANIARMAAVLRRLHALVAPPSVQAIDLDAIVTKYLKTLDHHGVVLDSTATAARARAVQIAAEVKAQVPTLCHNDVHALNVVDDGVLRLIDWEYAGRGEPLFDLASICVYHSYSSAQRQHLLASYLAAPDANAASRLELCCWLFDYIRDLWMAVRELQ